MFTAYDSNDIILNNITATETFNLNKFTENFQTIKEHINGTKTKIDGWIYYYGQIPSWLESKFPDTSWTRRPCRAYPTSIPKPTKHAKILLQSCPSSNTGLWSSGSGIYGKDIDYDVYGTNIQNIIIQGYNNSSSETTNFYPEWTGNWVEDTPNNGKVFRVHYSWSNNYSGRSRSLYLEFDYGDVVIQNYIQ